MFSPRSQRSLVAFVLPGCALLTLLIAWPVLQSAFSSLTNSVGAGADAQAHFAGLEHFKALISQASFWNSLSLAALFTITTTIIELLIAAAVALFLYLQKPLPRVVEVLLILPMFVLPVVSGLTFRYIYDPNDGPLSAIFNALGYEPMSPLADSFWAFWAIVLQDIWRMWPFLFLIIYAGLKALPKSAQEAAKMDGANTREVIRYVILPALRPTLAIAMGLKVMESLKVFTEVYVMTGGGPGDSTSLLSLFVVKQAFHFFQVGPASAASIVLLVLGMSLAWGVTRLQNRAALAGGK
ncbi:MAG: sugar ABC transporter permease [Betaproteobacteria bacterium]|nr:sugar ABC transporter permease [Betaproteobacteria bacterium]